MRIVYLETSVISYYCSRPSRDLIVAAHQQITCDWWENRLGADLLPVLSDEVIEEISQGDADVAARRMAAVADMKLLAATEDVRVTAQWFADALRLPAAVFADAIHIAFSVVYRCDYLATWNCRHIAGASAQDIIENVCLDRHLHRPRICTPEQLMEGYDEE